MLTDQRPTREDVRYLYRLLLGREPESTQVVDHWLSTGHSIGNLVDQFLASEEFSAKCAHGHDGVSRRLNKEQLHVLRGLVEELAMRHPQRELYQPVFGLAISHNGPTQRECVERCRLVVKALGTLPLSRMRVLDVGCAMGYVTFYMSEQFAQAEGFELDGLLLRFCIELNLALGKLVGFRQVDFFDAYADYTNGFDVCIMFSVVHYLVARHGLADAKKYIADIVRRFDVVVIELSSSLDYSYMPSEAADLLDGLTGVDIQLIGHSEKNNRPVFILKRKVVLCESFEAPIDSSYYGPIREDSCTRVYFSGETIIKVLSFLHEGNPSRYRREVYALQKLSNANWIVRLLRHGSSSSHGWLQLERIKGPTLDTIYRDGRRFRSGRDKAVLICKIIRAVSHMLGNGLYWNDISAHNIGIVDGDISLFDFGESESLERHDHIAMLSWLMHDLQVGAADSYNMGVYGLIHAAGVDTSRWSSCRFAAESGFFSNELDWIYRAVVGMPAVSGILNMEGDFLRKVNVFASQQIEFA